MKKDLLYEDESLLVCIKPVGVDSQEGMRELLREQLGVESFCVHRLDREVGGLMVFAKNPAAAAGLSAAIARRDMQKEYLTVLPGSPQHEEGVLRDLLFRDAAKNKSYVVKRRRKGVREAELEYRLLEQAEGLCLVRVKLHTGRSHQIRVQFASRGLPLLGDKKYGSREQGCTIALWSCRLAFPHPGSSKILDFSAMPESEYPWSRFEYIRIGKEE